MSIVVRPIESKDWGQLRRFHTRLSAETVEMRFHAAKRELTEPLAHRLCDLNGKDDVALVATRSHDGCVVGVARYARIDTESAEVAFVVEDAYQGHGIGSLLMTELRKYALEHGIIHFVAEVLPGNTRMLRLLHAAGAARQECRNGECTVEVDLLNADSSRSRPLGAKSRYETESPTLRHLGEGECD